MILHWNSKGGEVIVCWAWLVMVLFAPKAVWSQQAKASSNEPFQCLSEKAWLKDKQFLEPKSLEEAFREGPYYFPVIEKASLSDALSLPCTSSVRSKDVLLRIGEGTKQLHLMDDAAAELYFRDALRLNPECAAAWLGLVMANERYPERAVFFLRNANLAKDSGAGERAWLAAYESFFDHDSGADLVQRLGGLALKLKDLGQRGDEMKQFCAEAFSLRYEILAAHFAGLPVANLDNKDAWLKALTVKAEHQSLSVYGVLLWRDLEISKAVEFGELLTKNENSNHAKRLLADTYILGGMFDKAELLLRDIVFPGDFLNRKSLQPKHIQFRFDALKMLAWACFHQGKFDEAERIAHQALTEQRSPNFTALADVKEQVEDGYLQAWRLLVQLSLAMGRWEEVMEYTQLNLDQEPGQLAAAYRLFWAATSAVLMKDHEKFRSLQSQLAEKQKVIRNTPYLNEYDAEVSRCLQGLAALEKLCQGRITPYLHQITDVPVNVMSVLLTGAGAADVGEKRLKEALVQTPSSVPWSLVLKQVSEKPKEVSLDSMSVAFLPEKQSYSPLPSREGAAPGIKLPDKSGVMRDFSALSGQPTLLIFFLGQGCPHCIEQLQVFRSHIDSFERAGARIITVGTDSVQQLADTLGNSPRLDPELPYLILADPDLSAFKTWGCYDEFQNKPLHGTFLLDEQGCVVWRNISHDPYTQPVFLLQEFKRLMKGSSKVSSRD